MAGFDLAVNQDDEAWQLAPFPLRPVQHLAFSGKSSDLLPVFEIIGEKCFLDTPGMSAVPLNALGRRVGSLSDQQEAILAALDRIFGAY